MTKIRCYYEVLEVSRIATADEIKRAYRKQALIWHPDKNQHQLQVADERFKEVNHAYTILSDANERKWYDDHREAILRGTDDDSSHINLWAYFSTTCYDAYDDGERGFYTVYESVFQDIQKEEVEADEDFQATSSASSSRIRSVPMFGKSDADSADVIKFYQYWRDFVTKKRFTMADKYNTNDAPNRQIKRLMEKENQKERQFARQEYQDQVRHLVEFIYKRDKRVIEYIKKIRIEEEERKVKEDEERVIREAEHREALKLHRQQQQEEYERMKAAGVRFMEDDAEYEEVPEYYCVVCERTFKSSKKMTEHERSNLHKKNLKNLRSTVSIDGVDDIESGVNDMDLETPQDLSEDEDDRDEQKDSDYEEPYGMVKKGKNKKSSTPTKTKNSDSEQDDDAEEEIITNNNSNNNSKSKKKNKNKNKKVESDEDDDLIDVPGIVNKKKGKSKVKAPTPVEDEEDDEDEDEEEEEEVVGVSKKKNKNKKEKKSKKKNVISLSKDDDDIEDNDSQSDSEDSFPKSKSKQALKSKFLDSDSDDDKQKSQPKKIGKAKEKRLQREEKKKQKQQDLSKEEFKCHVCAEDFQTRNKLFQHIKDTKHAQAIVTNSTKKK
ncbi:DnaJ-like subfamily A member 5 protein [Heterostelium album PN500]|uniref:DnaJ-like subfamily A member 5 protein n=1 Tax=Heterostelium pallidum (strain ATCC 26659 / Pp 5 / PN500) TaxID=670386 RepID=D3BAT4_HETP5|nr:DnaJ-like subfamily A member 5 protein [Heterostelium album PN500]EFA81671.1 DnaJ-like subfamily A member 5 protein [Heterostelium album PN500]|eukprot:XP_020433788.1 DnaJ-like subfamily A member 5 protein [Heterostelium album PN500]